MSDVLLDTLATLQTGSFTTTTQAAEPAAAESPQETVKRALAEELLKDVTTYEKSVGAAHGMTPEQVQEAT